MINQTSVYTIVLFFILCFVLSIHYSKGKTSLVEYFLAKKDFNWFIVGFVAFVTNTAATTFITISAWSFRDGLAVFNFELTGIICCIILSLVFGRIYLANNIYTTPEYISKRFNNTTGYITSVLLIFMYIMSRISVILICTALVADFFLGIDLFTSSLFIIIFCGVYSIVGGQRTIVMTGFVIGWIMLVGGLLLPAFILTNAELGIKLTELPNNYLSLLKPIGKDTFSWPGVLLGMPIIGIWYHCINHELVQKFLGSKNYLHFQAGALFHGYLKLLVFPLVILPGLLGFIICTEAQGDQLYPMLIFSYVPKSIQGIVICGFLASGMVALSASFNACSTLFTFDFYRKIYPNANDFVLMNIGKIATIVIVIVSMIWVVLLQTLHSDIFLFVTSVLTYFTPPFAVIYLTGVLWARATPRAAMYTLISGIVLSFVKFIISFMNNNGWIENPFWKFFAEYNFFYFTCLLFVFNLFTIIILSYMEPAQDMNSIKTLLLKNNWKWEMKLPADIAFQKRIYFAAGILFLTVVGIYIVYG
jgi:SSS family solute:Na+ symporter